MTHVMINNNVMLDFVGLISDKFSYILTLLHNFYRFLPEAGLKRLKCVLLLHTFNGTTVLQFLWFLERYYFTN